MEKEQEMYFVQVQEMYDQEGKVIPIISMRLIKNADSFEEAIKIACEDILSQLGEINLGPVACLKTGDGTLQCLEKGEIIEIYVYGKLSFEVPILSILTAKPELLN